MKFERRIYLGIVVIVFGFLPVLLGAFFFLKQVVNEQNALIATNAQEVLLAGRLRYMDATQSELMPIFVLTGDAKLLKSFKARYQEFLGVASQLTQLEKNSETRELITKIQENAKRNYAFSLPGTDLKKKGRLTQSGQWLFQSRHRP